MGVDLLTGAPALGTPGPLVIVSPALPSLRAITRGQEYAALREGPGLGHTKALVNTALTAEKMETS